MIFAAPVAEVVLGGLRLRSATKLSMTSITALMMVAGLVLSFLAFLLLCIRTTSEPARNVCLMPEMSCLMTGCMLAIIVVPVIGFVFGLIYRIRRPESAGNEEVIARVNDVLRKHYK